MINLLAPRHISPGSAIAVLRREYRRTKTPATPADYPVITWSGERDHAVVASTGTTTGRLGWPNWLARLAGRAIPGYSIERDDGAASKQVFFDQLIKDVDPHRQPPRGPAWQARILAGRWLALRRARLGWSYSQLAQSTGVTTSALLLIETGLANETIAPTRSWDLLIEALGGRVPMAAPVAAVVAIALGRIEAVDPTILAQVVDDLSSIIMGGLDSKQPHIFPITTERDTPDRTTGRLLPTTVSHAARPWVVHGSCVVLMILLALTVFLVAQVQLRLREPSPPVWLRPSPPNGALHVHIPPPVNAVLLTDKRKGSPSCDLQPLTIEEIIGAQDRHERFFAIAPAIFHMERGIVPRRAQMDSHSSEQQALAGCVLMIKQPG